MRVVRVVSLCVVLAVACDRHVEPALRDVSVRDAIDTVIPDANDVAVLPVRRVAAPAFTITHADAAGRIDPADRLRVPDGHGGTSLPGNPDPTSHAAPTGTPLFAGDRIESGASALTLRDAHGRDAVLGADARAVIPTFAGSDVVLSRGELRVALDTTNPAPFVLDTPAVRARITHGSLRCLVADEGHTACAAIDAPVEIWPSPPAPASTLGARVNPHAHGHPGHPISLDVHVQELIAPARPLVRVTLQPGQYVTFGPDGAASSDRPAGLSDNAWRAWRSRMQSRLADASGHLYPLAQLARAATGDLADARAFLAEPHPTDALPALATHDGPSAALAAIAADDADRESTEFRLSCALGRAVARADRARTLAIRGGDVTALVPIAHLEEVLDAARAMLPTPASMLDSDERPHVP